MNKSICGREIINKKPPVLQSSNSNDNSNCKIRQPVAPETKNKKNDAPDYKSISLTLAGEISSAYINRSDLTKQKQPSFSFIENAEVDDEQFILNMKRNIDKNFKMQSKENHGLRHLQSKSYLSRKKKSAFSNEDQNLMKKFKISMNESKIPCIAPPKLQQSENVTSDSCVSNQTITTSTLQTIPSVAHNNADINTNLKNNATNQFLFHMTAQMQRNDQLITPLNIGTRQEITETEIEQLFYYELQCITPPLKEN